MNNNLNNKPSPLNFLVVGFVTLLIVSLAVFYWIFGKNSPSFVVSNSQPRAAIFVPKFSPAMVSLMVNPDALQKIAQKRELSQIKNSLLAKSNINYQDDLKPWLNNEITLAVTTLDIDRDPDNGLQTGYLMALATKNPVKSREFLELLFSKRAFAGNNLEIERYKGVKVIYDHLDDHQEYSPSQISNSLAGAIVNNFVLFANHPQVIKTAINNLQAPDLNLVSSLEYQKASQQIPKNSLAVTFFNLPEISKWQKLELAESTYHSQILSLALNSQGLLAESTFLTNSLVPPSLPLSQPVPALQYIPESTTLAISGANLSNLGNSDLAKLWKQGTATIYGSSEDGISRLIQPLIKIQQNLNLNFSQDIFSWVTREYALALLPNSENTTPNWVFIVEKTPQLAAGIAHLDNIASSSGFNVISLILNGQKVSAWTQIITTNENNKPINIDTKVKGVHTTLNNYEIFTSDLNILKEILSQKQRSLLENPKFKNSLWENSQNILKRQLPVLKFVELLDKPLFDNLQALTFSSYHTQPGIVTGGVFLQLH
ncbi:MAG: hypothetical protein RLZZ86_2493 [Cyanobacteriota bacterium]